MTVPSTTLTITAAAPMTDALAAGDRTQTLHLALAKIDELQAALNASYASLGASRRTVQELHATESAAVREHDTALAQTKSEADGLRGTIEQLRGDILALRTQLTARNAQAEARAAELRGRVDQLSHKIAEADTAAAQRQHKIAHRKTENDGLRRQIGSLQGTSADQARRIDAFVKTVDQLREESRQLRTTIDGHAAHHAALAQQLASLTQEHDRAHGAIADRDGVIARLQNANRFLLSDISSERMRADSAERDASSAESEASSLRGRVSSAESDARSAEMSASMAEMRISFARF